ncbi:MAG: TonB family protein [Pseudomonadales bacterium]
MAAIGFPLPRFLGSLFFASLATVGIAYLMHSLIKADFTEIEVAPPSPPIEWVRLLKEPPVSIKPKKVDPPPVIERQPPPVVQPTVIGDPTELVMEAFTPPKTGPTGPATGHADGDLLSIVAISPDYPERARARGIEGYVTLEFTVNARGRVVDARVIDAQPASIFNAAALRAIERFRYRPRVVDGKPLAVKGVKTRLRFSLDA